MTTTRVIRVVSAATAGDRATSLRALQWLLQRGWDAYLLSLGPGGRALRADAEAAGLLAQRVRLDRPWAPLASFFGRDRCDRPAAAIGELLSSTQKNIVHLVSGAGAIGCASRLRVARTILVADVQQRDLKQVGEHCWSHFAGLVVGSTAIRDHVLRDSQSVDVRFAVAGPTVESHWFAPTSVRTHGEVGTSARPLRLLAVGRLHWSKGHEFLLAGIRLLLDAGVAVELRIVGGGEHLRAIAFCRHQLGLEGSVGLLGVQSREQVRAELDRADLFVSPAVAGERGLALLEAQAMALPVVTADGGAYPDRVQHGITGFVVPRRDPRAIVERVSTLARDGSLRATLGEAGRVWVRNVWTGERCLAALAGLYERILSDHGGSWGPAEQNANKGVRLGEHAVAARRARSEIPA